MIQRKLRAGDMALIGMFAALMGVGANITSMAPFLQVAGIPLSLQPFFCLLAAMLLGSRRAAIAMTVYALAGLAGAPVFAQFSAGFAPFLGKSGGFILSYIPAAFAAGWLLERKAEPGRFLYAAASLIGTGVIYVIGTTYMYIALKLWLHAPISYGTAWFYMVWFFIKDMILAIILAFIAPAIYRSIHKATGFRRNHTSSV
ncbi:biotin transporter BioY [Bacillus sp. ISL-51]|uniref:biotin transporter BioY n=1 Tax=Bacteria TaxID=2 RepID=UPI001BEC115C|nr:MULTISPECIES: biotin transporter BioY [Bacteria]MBT2574888.1 biotin transporter BioY [Bacillus sp. ISL-51]MBT2635742.1 biotin transporter BioY [Bacillus sp. ISL-26]MBT2714155.1 biotin transporter BioY [Pseudomonas sp. ISL-88]